MCYRLVLLLCLLLAVGGGLCGPVAAADKPNIVFFLVDDLGWGAMSRFGNTYHETPNFDALCDRGVRFTNAYSACTVCSPSRAAILTGQSPARLHLTDWIPGHGQPKAKLQIPEWKQEINHSQVTLPEALRAAGYQTWFLGKWHLEPEYANWTAAETATAQAAHTPQKHGFDVNIGGREWGQPRGRGRYFYPFDMPGIESGEEGEYLTDRLTDEAIHLLDTAEDKPFLLYMSYYTVHTPVMGKPELTEYFADKSQATGNAPAGEAVADYAAMHKSLDESMGRILQKIDQLGLADNTIVVFTGDNGGDRHYACGDLRGRKGLAYEGGTREPTCIVWPGVTPPGSVCDTPIIGMDFYPTLLDAVGLEAEINPQFDGVSLKPLLDGLGTIDRQNLYWHYPHYHRTTPYSAVRSGDWKLIEFLEDGKLELYNLAQDPKERKNLAKANPAKAAELHRLLDDWRQQVGAQMPTPNPNYEAPADGNS